jgi:hypothetical protein
VVAPEGAKQLGGGLQAATEAEGAQEVEAVEGGPVLDDAPVPQPADRQAGQLDRPSVIGAGEGPAAGDAVAVGKLVDDVDGQVVEQRAVDGGGAADTVEAVEL